MDIAKAAQILDLVASRMETGWCFTSDLRLEDTISDLESIVKQLKQELGVLKIAKDLPQSREHKIMEKDAGKYAAKMMRKFRHKDDDFDYDGSWGNQI